MSTLADAQASSRLGHQRATLLLLLLLKLALAECHGGYLQGTLQFDSLQRPANALC